MKNLIKITKYFITLFWLGLNCSILKGEIVITEIFILQADDSHTPQYIELYNNSSDTISVENWSITIFDESGLEIIKSDIDNSGWYVVVQADNLEIDPFGYFLISSSKCDYSTSGCNFYCEPSEDPSDIIAKYIILPFYDPSWNYIDKGSIVLTNDNNVEEDRIDYDITAGWPVGENSRGRSLRLHVAPNSDNNDPNNWSLSPKTERSIWLYDEVEDIKGFGSPREENSFRLFDIQYSDSWFPDISYANGGTHTIYGDFYDFYRAEPYEDFGADKLPDTGDEGEGNGIWDLDEEYHDRNLNNIWDHQDNNFGDPLEFSWLGTFIENTPDFKYELIIEKNGMPIPNSSWMNITDTAISIPPIDLTINELGSYREIAEYTWRVELTKTFPNTIDTIYSDKYTFFIDASDYGIYGCVDNGSCADDGNCPTNAHYESSYISNYPTGCVPGDDISAGGCYSALNYYEDANINSNTCQYVSLSIPAFVVGDADTIARVPIYFTNESPAEINEIKFVLKFDNSSGILTYNKGTFSGTIFELGVGSDYIFYDPAFPDSISVNIPISSVDDSFAGEGIITYLDFDLVGEQGAYTDISLTDISVKGDEVNNDISLPVKDGEIVILQTDYEISGQVYYYDYSSDQAAPFEVPNVELILNKNYDGISYSSNFSETTNENGYFKFDLLTEGNYNLSFSKESSNACNGNDITGIDISRISRHINGSEPFNADQLIAADVSLDGTVSGYDASLVAQYSVDLIDNFNDIHTHWNFKPFDEETLPNVHAELLKHNGQYSIEYKPLVLDDPTRHISAYRLGDVNGNYCQEPLSRYNNRQVQFTNIAIDYTPVITLPIIISDPTFMEGMDIEIGYDEDVFSPHLITFNTSIIKTERYNSVSNLLSSDGSIKTVTWSIEEPQIVEGKIGEVSFNWNNNKKSGKIWLKYFQINDEPAVGGISLIGLIANDVVEGVNIINSLIPVELSLHQNYPNPFNPQTTIKWSMPLSGIVSLEVYNLQGQLVELLINGQLAAGIHEQIWDATAYPSGIYFYRLTSNGTTLQRIMLLLK